MKVSVQGLNHPNQDAAGSYKTTFWVLDGATPLFPEVLGGWDVERTVQAVSRRLTSHGNSRTDLVTLLEEAICDVSEEYRVVIPDFDSFERYELPTFACALGRIEGNRLSYLILADCEIRTSSGKRLTDPSFAATSALNHENELQILREYGADSLEKIEPRKRKKAVEELWKMNRAQRMKLNTPDGYWVGSLDGAGLTHALIGTAELEENEHVFAMSDGFAHLVDADPTLLEITSVDEMKKRISELRNITDDDVTVITIR